MNADDDDDDDDDGGIYYDINLPPRVLPGEAAALDWDTNFRFVSRYARRTARFMLYFGPVLAVIATLMLFLWIAMVFDEYQKGHEISVIVTSFYTFVWISQLAGSVIVTHIAYFETTKWNKLLLRYNAVRVD